MVVSVGLLKTFFFHISQHPFDNYLTAHDKTLLWKWYFWLNEIKPTLDLVICPFCSLVGVVLLLLVLLLNKLVIPSIRSPNRKLLLFDILTSGSLGEPNRSLKDLFSARMIKSLYRAQYSFISSQMWNTTNQKCILSILSCHWFTKLVCSKTKYDIPRQVRTNKVLVVPTACKIVAPVWNDFRLMDHHILSGVASQWNVSASS